MKNNGPQLQNITDLAKIPSIDFWVLFWIVPPRQCSWCEPKGCSPNKLSRAEELAHFADTKALRQQGISNV